MSVCFSKHGHDRSRISRTKLLKVHSSSERCLAVVGVVELELPEITADLVYDNNDTLKHHRRRARKHKKSITFVQKNMCIDLILLIRT